MLNFWPACQSFWNPYKLSVCVYSAQIASPNYKYLNINESESLRIDAVGNSNKTSNWQEDPVLLPLHVNFFFYFIISKMCSYKWQQILIMGEGKEWIIDLHRWDLFQRLIHWDNYENAKL